jgi:hypothetical protein
MTPRVTRSDGAEMKPYEAIFPILVQVSAKQFCAI